MLSRLVLTLCLITCMFATGQQASPVSNESIFSYDKNLPLGLREAEAEKVPDATVHNISYPSPKGGLVTAYLVVPDGKGPFGAIEFVHWGQGNRTEFLSEALLYARAGVISLLLDAPHARPDFHKSPSFIDDPQRERDVFVQLVIDCRRGFDLLLSRPDVDPK